MSIYSNKFFKNPIEIIEAKDEEIKFAFDKTEELKKQYYLLGYINYDFNELYFEVYQNFEEFIPQKITKPFGTIITPLISKEYYFKAINKIKEYIAQGITYEVNYTYPSKIETNLDDFELYEKLLDRQTTPYNVFIQNKKHTLLSFSPELFFRLKGNKILTKPMKGTIARGKTKDEDNKNKNFLYSDIKNRAENIMIVDLLRNDLGRISKPGSVKVDKLFEIEEHKTLFQMTSEVSSELCEGTKLYDIFKAIFPFGSITGAPKISTMKIIKELEPFNRNIYCGAIGFLSPDITEFSVPIRIIQKLKNEFIYYSGGAIVWDSDANEEWQETITKTKFLDTDFHLIETIKDDFLLHIERMKNSADELGFKWNKEIEKLTIPTNSVLRIELYKDGTYKTSEKIITEPKNNKIVIKGIVNTQNPFLYHKTSIRDSMPDNVFDEIRTNEKGEITEGTYTNIAILKNKVLYTPPVKCGLLNGILRSKMVKKGELKEKILYKKDLETADKIFCLNSVRGVIEVKLC